MKKSLLFFIATILTVAFISCGGGDDDIINDINNPVIDIDNNDKSNNYNIVSIDDKNFYINYVKYSVREGHLEVSGYDKDGFKGVANIASKVTYKGNTYEVLGIGNNAFNGCKMLTSITIPNTVTYISDGAFRDCTSLVSIIIPNNVTTIGSSAFDGCNSLENINIPDGVTNIGSKAFAGCSNLKSIRIPDGVTSIYACSFQYCSSLTSVTLSKNITLIDMGSFSGCESLTTIEIPNSVTNIGKSCFKGCKSLISITLGSKVSYIGLNTFYDCTELKDIYSYAEKVPRVESGNPSTLFGSYDYREYEPITLHVLSGLLSDYKNTHPWSKFGRIVGLN